MFQFINNMQIFIYYEEMQEKVESRKLLRKCRNINFCVSIDHC